MIRYHTNSLLVLILVVQNLFSQEQPEENVYQLLYLGKYESISDRLDKMIKVDSTNSELYFLLGLTNKYQNNRSKALQYFKKSYNIDSQNLKNLVHYANALLNIGYLTQAENVFREAIKLDSSRIDTWESLGRLLYRNLRFEESSEIYSRLSRSDSTNGYYYFMQARCAMKMDSSNKATKLYKKAHDNDPDNIEIIIELSRNYFILDSLGNAKNLIETGLALDKKNRRLHRLKAYVLYKQEDYTVATLSFLDAIAYGDKSVELLKKLGFCYFADKNYFKSNEIFKESLQYDNQDPIIYYYLALCSKQMKQDRQAINHFNTALLLIHPEYLGNLYISLSECYHNEQEYIHAIRNLRKAGKYSSAKDIIYYNLANVYYDYYEDRSIAKIYYEKASEYDLDLEIQEFINHRIKELTVEIFFKK